MTDYYMDARVSTVYTGVWHGCGNWGITMASHENRMTICSAAVTECTGYAMYCGYGNVSPLLVNSVVTHLCKRLYSRV